MKTRILILSAVISLYGCEYNPGKLRFDKQSEYERVLVYDKGDRRYLRFGNPDSGNQSIISLSDPRAVPSEYIRFATLGVLLTPKLDRVMMIGLGGGTFTTLLKRHFPNLYIDAVEIDPVVVEAAKTFFNVQEDERFKIHVADGAKFIRESQSVYDLIFIDAYSGEGIPRALFSPKFFDAIKARTSVDGVVILNLFKQKGKEDSFIQILRPRFPFIACVNSSDDLNTVIFCKASSMPIHADLIAAAKRFTAVSTLSFDLDHIARNVGMECKTGD